MYSELREYLEDILAMIERGDDASGALRNILDEKIPKPPRKVAPAKPLRKNLIKRRAEVKEFDPTLGQPQGEPSFQLIMEIPNLNLKEYRAIIHDNYRFSGDVMLFLNDMRPKVDDILHEDMVRQNGVRYSL